MGECNPRSVIEKQIHKWDLFRIPYSFQCDCRKQIHSEQNLLPFLAIRRIVARMTNVQGESLRAFLLLCKLGTPRYKLQSIYPSFMRFFRRSNWEAFPCDSRRKISHRSRMLSLQTTTKNCFIQRGKKVALQIVATANWLCQWESKCYRFSTSRILIITLLALVHLTSCFYKLDWSLFMSLRS